MEKENQIMNEPYIEKMSEQLNQLSLTPIHECAESDISNLADLEKDGVRVKLNAYQADVAEKIAIGSIAVDNEVSIGACTIIPKNNISIPIYVSRWEERQDTITLLVDMMPTVDMVVDEAYRVKYLEPLNETWERFSNLSGIQPEDDNDLRAACSIIYTGACVPIEKEGMRMAALAPHLDYLKKYIAYMTADHQPIDEAKQKEVIRRIAAVRMLFSANLKNLLSKTVEQKLGKEICDLFCNALT
jgi:hypothetical protein